MHEVRLVGLCSRNIKVVDEHAKMWKCAGWKDPLEMLNSSNVDVVFISTPISSHFSLAKQAIKAGKHVWCEKPLTCSLADTQELVSLAKKKSKVITESFMYLYHPLFYRIKKFVADSKKIHSVVCRFGIPNLDNPGFRNNPKLCGGAFWDVASYATSAVLSLFPDQKAQVLFAEILKNENSRVDNNGRAVLRFSKGITAYLEWGTGLAYKNEIDLWAEDGSFFTDKIFSKPKEYIPHYKIRDLNGNEFIKFENRADQFVEMFRNFVQIMRSEQRITAEREIILKRAELMDDVFNFNGV